MPIMHRLVVTVVSLLLLLSVARAIDPVYISEFVASNKSGLTDEEGDFSDWIEIYNTGSTPVNLLGWSLTDDAADLTKWSFPSVNLDPNGLLIVFASSKNRVNPARPLHTNFNLSANGGYLALVKPGGIIAHEYNPYPAQYDDKPYGLQQTVSTTTLIAPTASLKWFVPAAAAPDDATWTAQAFVDSSWTSGANGVGFATTVPGFAFRTFFANVGVGSIATANQVIATPSLQALTYEETRAVVNYLDSGANGHYAPQSNPAWITGNADNYVVEAKGIITIPAAGAWTFGVNSDDGFQLQVRSVGATTWTTVCGFDGTRTAADTLGTFTFPATGDFEIRVMIYESTGGSSGEAFAKQGTWTSWDSGFKLIGDTANGGLAVKSSPIGTASSGYASYIGTGSNLVGPMYNANPRKTSAYIRYSFGYPGNLDSLSLPVRYDDGIVVYLNGTEVARRNAPAGTPTNTSTASSDRYPLLAIAPETIDLTPFRNLLVSGAGNVLAIHGLNDSADSGDFLVKAELASNTVTTDTTSNYFTTPTPNAFNTAAIYQKVAPVTTSVERGFYSTAQTVALATGTSGATIRYTFDGSSPYRLDTAGNILRDVSGNPLPSPTSGIYSAPLTVNKTTVLRYAAFKNGSDPSDSVTQTYIFVNDVINQSPANQAPSIANPPGASPATTTWPTSATSGQTLDYGMDPNVVGAAAYSGTIRNDLKAVPTFSIVTDVANLFSNTIGIYVNPSGDTIDWERPGSLELIYPDGTTAGFQANCGIRLRGGFSRSPANPKHAFRVFFRGEYGPATLKYPLFGSDPTAATEFQKFDIRCAQNYSWSFQGDSANGVYMRDEFNRRTQLAMGELSSHGDFYHLYVNGQYWGLYNIDERPEASFGASYLGGSQDDYDTIKVAPDNNYTIYATDGNTDAWFNLWSLADGQMAASKTEALNNTAYQRLLGNNPDGTRNPAYPVLLDATNLVDYNLCIYWGGNLDAAISNFLSNQSPNNWFGFRDRTDTHGGFRFVVHDSEHTLLNPSENRTGPWPAGSSAAQGAATAFTKSSPQYIFQQCIYAQEFKTLFADRVFKHFNYGGALSTTAATARFDALQTAIDRAIVGESARWGDAKTEPPLTHDTNWLPAMNTIRTSYLPVRTANVLQQFRAKGWYPAIDPPTWSTRGGTVASGTTVSLALVPGQTGTIYYTTNGADPRALGGGISPSAIVYSAPISIDHSKVIRTRLKNGTVWSAIDEATFYTTQNYTGLAITEINYNPLPNGAVSGDEYEFLELKNTTANIMDLAGLQFSNGLTYTFPPGAIIAPGGFFILARNPAEFHIRYPAVTANGVYSGKLKNGGETISIIGPTGGPVISVSFSDTPPWPVTPDGNGFTLVPKGLAFNSTSGADWRASAAIGGSPGADDPPVIFPEILVNEALSNSTPPLKDTIELYNPTAASVDIGNWWLSDDPNAPQKYRIPANTVIAAAGYFSFNETQFNPTPGFGTSFALNAASDDVYLFSGDASGNLTGYSHGFSFKGGEANVSFGRYLNSAGEEQFPRQISRTFGGANSGPLVGPLVISEIMYHPYPGYDEYVEIRNISDVAINLYDPSNPANTWKLSGLGYTFPQGQFVPAGGVALLVSIDPTAFRDKYGVAPEVQIFGPYSGLLQDGGERLSLEMPDAPTTQGGVTVIPYDVIDSVRYDDKSPWPIEADGGGPSLQRLSLSAYADDSANWSATGATPGRENASNVLPTVSLTSPADNATFNLPANITFEATAADANGSIFTVDYYVDGGKVGESATGPTYTFVWAATPGAHTVTAKAVDNSLGVSTSTPITIYATTSVTQGLKAEYFNNPSLSSVPAGVRTDATVVFSGFSGWAGNTGFPGVTTTNFSVRWSGQVRAINSGLYSFYTVSDDGARLYVNGQQLINNWVSHTATENTGTITLVGGQLYSVVMEYFQSTGSAAAQLRWAGPGVSKQSIPQTQLYPDGPPIIIAHPGSLTREFGTSATFTVQSSGAPQLGYHWRRNGVNIPGATSDTLALPYVLMSDAGRISVLVSNASGFAISNDATLTVTYSDTDGDGIQDAWETAHGLNKDDPVDAPLDSDGDGKTNLEEFVAGTDPNDPKSKLVLSIVQASSGTGNLLSFTAQPYVGYTIQFKNSLSGSTWTKLADVDPSPTTRDFQYTDTPGSGELERFYRVITPKQ